MDAAGDQSSDQSGRGDAHLLDVVEPNVLVLNVCHRDGAVTGTGGTTGGLFSMAPTPSA